MKVCTKLLKLTSTLQGKIRSFLFLFRIEKHHIGSDQVNFGLMIFWKKSFPFCQIYQIIDVSASVFIQARP